MKIQYSKKALSFQEQIDQLKSRGLIINDNHRALHYFSHINYYRFSAYTYPFLADKEKHIFKEGVTFQNILDLYNFDRELRLLIMDAVERIEVSFRTNIIYALSHKYNPFWLSEKDNFYDKNKYQMHIERVTEELRRSDEQFIEHYFSKYTEKLPPSWITMEVISFSLLSLLFQNLRYNKDQKEVANRYGLNHIVFTSWFHSLVYVRNVCAHHCRLWNRELRIRPNLPKSIGGLWLSTDLNYNNNRIFYVIAVIIYFLTIINPTSHFKTKLRQLLEKYPMVDLDSMGFPEGWEEEQLFR